MQELGTGALDQHDGIFEESTPISAAYVIAYGQRCPVSSLESSRDAGNGRKIPGTAWFLNDVRQSYHPQPYGTELGTGEFSKMDFLEEPKTPKKERTAER